jgi:SAM-dependent methyltransferase
MSVVPLDRAAAAAAAGGRTLEALANTPRLNRWIVDELAGRSAATLGEVLEVGSGIGNLSRLLVQSSSRAVLTEVEPHYLESLRRELGDGDRVEVMSWDLDRPPPPALAARRFDSVVSVNVLEHIDDDRAAVGALASLLRPGGSLLVYVPACPFAFGSMDVALGHHRRYTRGSLRALLESAGLRVEQLRYMNRLGLMGWLVSGRLLRRRRLSPRLLGTFERVVSVARALDRLAAPLPLGLGLVARARLGGAQGTSG